MASAGRVAIVPKGEFELGKSYTRLDLVSYENNAYVAKKDSAYIFPTDEEYWMLVFDFLKNTNYDILSNKPKINGVVLEGNVSLDKLGVQPEGNYANSSDLTKYSLIENTGYELGLSVDTTTYIMTLELKNSSGKVLSSKSVDFPIESMVIGASYANGKLTLSLQNGKTLDVNISDIVSGLVKDTFTIAGIDMKDNITAAELISALGISDKMDKTGDAANTTVTFSQASTRANIKSKETQATIMGKIAKFFADLKNVAFSGSYSDLTDTPSAFDRSNDGLVPHPTTTTSTRYLREDGTWVVPTNTTYSAMSTSELTTGTATTARTVRADYLKAGIESIAESADIDTTNNTVAFTQATARANIASGESHKTIFGKIAKLFADLKTVAFTGSYNDLSDKPTIPSNTDANVTQTNTTGSAAYRLLLSYNANDTTQTVGARKSANFTANPSTGELTAPTFVGNLKGDVTGNVDGGLKTTYTNTGEIKLSDYRTAGIYVFGSGCTFSEDDPIPIGVNGYLIVIPNGVTGSNVKQFWTRQGTINLNDYTIYMRQVNSTGTNVGEWVQFAMFGAVTNNRVAAIVSGKVATTDITTTQLGYLSGVTSNIQTQLNALSEKINVLSEKINATNKDIPYKVTISGETMTFTDSNRT